MHRNILDYLYDIVEVKPGKTAYSDGEVSMNFFQVHEATRAIGSFLAEKNIYKKPVVVFMQRSPQEIAAFFGIVAGGNFYVPVDEEMPAVRIQHILNNLHSPLLICDEASLSKVQCFKLHGAELAIYEEISKHPENNEVLARIYDAAIDIDPIYIVFTSGSTGIPKGVAACHRSVIDYIEQLSEVLGFSGDTIFGNQTPLYFDACLKEIYPTLKFGATTYLIPRKLFATPLPLVEYLNEHRINTICWVVSAMTMLSAFDTFSVLKPQYLHTVAFGSEVFPIKQFNIWRKALPEASFTNLYGPTEGTGMCCYYRIEKEFSEGDIIPIGRPFDNREILLVKDDGTRAAHGEEGEICLRGNAVTLGYYNDPERTAASFVQNPFNDAYPEVIYRTGDIGRLNDEGELFFVSRKDHQIKHMGHRIELGEVEANAYMFEAVKICSCIYDEMRREIVLFYSGDIEERELSAKLKDSLPRYMLPGVLRRLETMPLTANGKIDRVALKNSLKRK